MSENINTIIYSLRNVSKEVDDGEKRKILDNISLDIYDRDFCGVVGKSGSGKSTLLNILGGIDLISSGSLHFFGRNISINNNRQKMAIFRRDIGFIFQSFQLIDGLSIYENVALPLRLRKETSSKINAKVIQALKDSRFIEREDTDIAYQQRLSKSPKNLSGGEKQRVAIARALVNDPKVILADEPTGSLDSHNQEVIMKLLLSLHKVKKITIVLVSHSSEIIEKCPRVIEIEDGKLL
jgi:putative ABC transport system ATP-binding protein